MISDTPFVQYYTSPTAYQGLGWAVEPANSKTNTPLYIFHDGTGRGYQSEMNIEPSTGNGVILLSNKIWYLDDGMFIGYLFKGIQDIQQGKEPAAINPNFDLLRAIVQILLIALLVGAMYSVIRQKRRIKHKKVFKTLAVLGIVLGLAGVPLLILVMGSSINVLLAYIPDFVVTTTIISIELLIISVLLFRKIKSLG